MDFKEKRLFVTVGTTQFSKLIETIQQDEVLYKLSSMGFKEIQFQVGTGKYEQKEHQVLKLKYTPFFDDFLGEVTKSDLVISHAGAGTCLEVLHTGKPLIVVINEDLMDNHQSELAEQLQSDEYLYFCTCNELVETLDKNLKSLRKYPKPNKQNFSNYLNKCMGFA